MNRDTASVLIERIILGLLVGALLLLGFGVLQPFFAPIAWAVILVFVTWPVYRRIRVWLRGHHTASALAMTLLLAATFAIPMVWFIALLRDELPAAYRTLSDLFSQGRIVLPESVTGIPRLGPELQRILDESVGDPQALQANLRKWLRPVVDETLAILGNVGFNIGKFGFAIVTAFFIYRDGDHLLSQTRQVLQRFIRERTKAYLGAVADTTTAVLYGLVLTALVQGLLTGLGCWVAGVKAPVLLGVITAIFALIPFGTPVAWGSIGLWLVLEGNTFAGIGLLLWGALVVSQIDNVIRPLIVSSVTRIPFVLVMFSVLGGIAKFGLIGIFLGPVIIAMLMAVWREWASEVEH